MTAPEDSMRTPNSTPHAGIDAVIERFEQAWQQGERPDIAVFLAHAGDTRRELLIELIHIDLEMRLKAGEAIRVESYLQRFTELDRDLGVVLDLIVRECELRQRLEADLALDTYVQRFPDYWEELRPRLRATEAATLSATVPAWDSDSASLRTV